MGKRSDFARRPMDNYATPAKAVIPLLPHIQDIRCYAEPCCGDGSLIQALDPYQFACVWASDIRDPEPLDALAIDFDAVDELSWADAIITNPPWTWKLMLPLLQHFMRHKPTWFLLSADFAHNVRSSPWMDTCTHYVSVGRLRWQPGSKHVGKDNAAWYRFEKGHQGGPRFYPRPYEHSLIDLMEAA